MAYRRYTITLRFEKGERIPLIGDRWHAETALGGQPVLVTLLRRKRLYEHPDEPGVWLMDAMIARRDLPAKVVH